MKDIASNNRADITNELENILHDFLAQYYGGVEANSDRNERAADKLNDFLKTAVLGITDELEYAKPTKFSYTDFSLDEKDTKGRKLNLLREFKRHISEHDKVAAYKSLEAISQFVDPENDKLLNVHNKRVLVVPAIGVVDLEYIQNSNLEDREFDQQQVTQEQEYETVGIFDAVPQSFNLTDNNAYPDQTAIGSHTKQPTPDVLTISVEGDDGNVQHVEVPLKEGDEAFNTALKKAQLIAEENTPQDNIFAEDGILDDGIDMSDIDADPANMFVENNHAKATGDLTVKKPLVLRKDQLVPDSTLTQGALAEITASLSKEQVRILQKEALIQRAAEKTNPGYLIPINTHDVLATLNMERRMNDPDAKRLTLTDFLPQDAPQEPVLDETEPLTGKLATALSVVADPSSDDFQFDGEDTPAAPGLLVLKADQKINTSADKEPDPEQNTKPQQSIFKRFRMNAFIDTGGISLTGAELFDLMSGKREVEGSNFNYTVFKIPENFDADKLYRIQGGKIVDVVKADASKTATNVITLADHKPSSTALVAEKRDVPASEDIKGGFGWGKAAASVGLAAIAISALPDDIQSNLLSAFDAQRNAATRAPEIVETKIEPNLSIASNLPSREWNIEQGRAFIPENLITYGDPVGSGVFVERAEVAPLAHSFEKISLPAEHDLDGFLSQLGQEPAAFDTAIVSAEKIPAALQQIDLSAITDLSTIYEQTAYTDNYYTHEAYQPDNSLEPLMANADIETPAEAPALSLYPVAKGDILSQIVENHRDTYDCPFTARFNAFVAANPQIINVDLILPGESIQLPSSDACPRHDDGSATVVQQIEPKLDGLS